MSGSSVSQSHRRIAAGGGAAWLSCDDARPLRVQIVKARALKSLFQGFQSISLLILDLRQRDWNKPITFHQIRSNPQFFQRWAVAVRQGDQAAVAGRPFQPRPSEIDRVSQIKRGAGAMKVRCDNQEFLDLGRWPRAEHVQLDWCGIFRLRHAARRVSPHAAFFQRRVPHDREVDRQLVDGSCGEWPVLALDTPRHAIVRFDALFARQVTPPDRRRWARLPAAAGRGCPGRARARC